MGLPDSFGGKLGVMAGIPNFHDVLGQPVPGQRAQGQPLPGGGQQGGHVGGLGVLAPAREILRVVRKPIPDGRVLEFLYRQATRVGPDRVYKTWELVQPVTGDCGCSMWSPEQATWCAACFRIVDTQYHAATCQRCGLTFGSCCLVGVLVSGVRAVVCRSCKDELSAGLLRKAWTGARTIIWGGAK